MKTKTFVAIFAAVSTLVFFRPVFAQTDGVAAPEFSNDGSESAMAPDFDEPWDDATPSFGGTALAPAPEQPVDPELPPAYAPPAPVGLIEPWSHPAISPSSPTLIAPDSLGRSEGVFDRGIR